MYMFLNDLQVLKSALTEFHIYVYMFFYKKLTYILIFFQFFFKNFYSKSIPIGLSNNIALKHPIFLAVFYIFFFKGNKFFLWNCFIVLLLGSWWASCEFNWGGFWSFDFVENTVLFFFLLKFLIYHKNFRNKRKKIFFFEFLFFFFFLKFFPVNSIHSFNSQVKCFYPFFLLSLLILFKFRGRYDVYIYVYIIYYLTLVYKVYAIFLLSIIFLKKFFRFYSLHKKIFYVVVCFIGMVSSTYNYIYFFKKFKVSYLVSINSKNTYLLKKNILLYKLYFFNYSIIYYTGILFNYDRYISWFNYLIV